MIAYLLMLNVDFIVVKHRGQEPEFLNGTGALQGFPFIPIIKVIGNSYLGTAVRLLYYGNLPNIATIMISGLRSSLTPDTSATVTWNFALPEFSITADVPTFLAIIKQNRLALRSALHRSGSANHKKSQHLADSIGSKLCYNVCF